MKKFVMIGMGLCVILACSSCKSSESAYKKAYEKAKQQELADASAVESESTEVTPMTTVTPVTSATTTTVESVPVREEKVELVSGNGLKAYSVVCGSFKAKTNADGLKSRMDDEGYDAKVVYNAEKDTYRVIVESFDTRSEAVRARDAFKAKYPDNKDFQGAWLLYNVN
ncbi:MAG TPA: SPOR domain-containing protein [Candidatus Phocaeicola gallistercoris]|jgi:cell division protein FtsN|nr:SPOR domain-containing protein [Candidatus Phocaeicola gallistercoris]